MQKIQAHIVANEGAAKNIHRLTLGGMEKAVAAFTPGQFAHLRVPNAEHLLLRRPLGIARVDAERGQMTFFYALRGEGTHRLAEAKPGEALDVVAPIGRGYSLPEGAKSGWVIGGGLGIAPLLGVVERWREVQWTAVLGYPAKTSAYLLEEFEAAGARLWLCSDDGTLGEKGVVTGPLKALLAEERPDVVMMCGPLPMFRACVEMLRDTGIPVQLSMEQRMACGVGACQTCVCKTNREGYAAYKRVCVDGPVFALEEVDLA